MEAGWKRSHFDRLCSFRAHRYTEKLHAIAPSLFRFAESAMDRYKSYARSLRESYVSVSVFAHAHQKSPFRAQYSRIPTSSCTFCLVLEISKQTKTTMNSYNSNNGVLSNNGAQSAADSAVITAQPLDSAVFAMNREDYEYQRSLQLAYAASLAYSINDVPSDADIQATAYLFKEFKTFNCVICLEDDIPEFKAYVFNCDHMVCCSCARNITSRFCPICRADISSGVCSKKKTQLEQLRMDSKLARALANGEEYNDSDADTVIVENGSDSDDDVVFIQTKKSETVTTTTTEKHIIQKKKDRKRSAPFDRKPSANKKPRDQKRRYGSDSDDEWTPV